MIETLIQDLDTEVIYGVLSGRASRAINRELGRSFRFDGMSITPEQWTVLLSLSKKDKVTQQELAYITFKDKPGISRIISNLEKMNLVKRVADINDKRNNLISITSEGLSINERARQSAILTMKRALHNFTENEVSLGQAMLKKIFYNLS